MNFFAKNYPKRELNSHLINCVFKTFLNKGDLHKIFSVSDSISANNKIDFDFDSYSYFDSDVDNSDEEFCNYEDVSNNILIFY